ncbi:MAG: 4-hydroxy-3-methylbut-2-enyl diphosphate reductase [Bacteroidales bacterium]|nr:4-hydroxy-3-methylbut-2-enyl diphosphate reductase [Bacteroidales bacterium]
MMDIRIDPDSGFCFGVVNAIRKAEEHLGLEGSLFCLGDIVHNTEEVERLRRKGLSTVTHAELANLHNARVLLRAHGEPPATYDMARRNGIEVIDATCPVVLQLQRRIKQAYDDGVVQEKKEGRKPQILIYGKNGHAEVNGLVGQTQGEAIVIQGPEDLDKVDFSRDILLYSQTTKSLSGFSEIVERIRDRLHGNRFEWYDTICRQVATRMEKIRAFASSHEVVVFVSGVKSSNGKVLYAGCLEVNPRSHHISGPEELRSEWFEGVESVGICGATSTPLWLMESVARRLQEISSDTDR